MIDFEYEDDDLFYSDEKYEFTDEHYSPVRSASQYLYNAFCDDHYETDDQHKTEEVLHQVLCDLNRTINLTSNSGNGKEEVTLTVKYSAGTTVNDLQSNCFYVNPNILLDDSLTIIPTDEKYFDALDGLNGQALLCSFIKKNRSPISAHLYKMSNIWAAKNIYMTDIQTEATGEIALNWPGFMSYVNQQMIVFGQKKAQIMSKLKDGIKNKNIIFDDIIEILCFNRLSSDKIAYEKLPDDFREKLVKADAHFNNTLDQKSSKHDKFHKAVRLYKDILDIFDPENQPDDQEIKVQKIDSEMERSYTGGDFFHDKIAVDGNIVSGTLDHEKRLTERLKVFDDELKNRNLKDDLVLTEKKYKLLVPPVNPDTVLAYNKIINKYKGNIKYLKTLFQFKNSHNDTYSFGTDFGEIDENSLYKVHYKQYDRLHMAKDMIANKKYHITIALDQSASMRNNMNEASELAVVFAEAIKSLRDVSVSVYGFQTKKIDTIVYLDKKYQKLEALSQSEAAGSTALGFHIAAIADKTVDQYSSVEKKIMIIITDGLPTHGSSRLNPVKHTSYCVNKAKNMGISVFGIGVNNAFNSHDGEIMFGKSQFAVIGDVAGTLPLLAKKLKKFLQRV